MNQSKFIREINRDNDFYHENKHVFSPAERKAIKKKMREALKKIGDRVVDLIDEENNQ